VAEKSSTVLLAGIGRGPFEAIAPVLDRHHLGVERADSPEQAQVLARSSRFDLIIFDCEPESLSLPEIIDSLREPSSASRMTSVMVVAAPDSAAIAQALVGRGVNRVVTLAMSEDIIDQHVADLLDIAPRAAVRYAARLSAVLDDGTIELIGQTVNLSATGMLVQGATILEPGQRVVFDVTIPENGDTVSGEAEIVRHATTERGGVDGVGVRFLEFYGDGRERVRAALTRALINP
jgi:hypothetical protein